MPKGRKVPPVGSVSPLAGLAWTKTPHGWTVQFPNLKDVPDSRADDHMALVKGAAAEAARRLHQDFGRGAVVYSVTPDGINFITAIRADDVARVLDEWNVATEGLAEQMRTYNPRSEYVFLHIGATPEESRGGIISLAASVSAA